MSTYRSSATDYSSQAYSNNNYYVDLMHGNKVIQTYTFPRTIEGLVEAKKFKKYYDSLLTIGKYETTSVEPLIAFGPYNVLIVKEWHDE